MLAQILIIKQQIVQNSKTVRNITDFSHVIQNLNISLSNNQDTYWRDYLHATLLSIYLKQVGYNLRNWSDYISVADNLAQVIGIRKNKNEAKILEYFLLHTINYTFNLKEVSENFTIKAFRANSDSTPTYLTDDSNLKNILSQTENEQIINDLKIVMKLRGLPRKEVWGDNDIIVLVKYKGTWQQFCIISCKTSLRERVYQSIFWATHSRLEGLGRHVFLTLDKGSSGKSEIGHRDPNTNDARKTRDVLESTMDRVYVLRGAEDVNRSQVIKDFTHLKVDLIAWAKDILGL